MSYEPESVWLIEHKDANGVSVGVPMFSRPDSERVYVDLGCAHPINKSLTHFCRDLGWRGVAVDGNMDYANDWGQMFGWVSEKNHFYLALLSDQPSARFCTHENAFTSRISDSPETDHPERWGIARINEIKTIPLEQILADRGIGNIDLLTCDLEGMEARVLRTLDWEKHQPVFVIVEYVTAGEGICCDAANLLIEKGYELIQMFPSNLIFRRK